MLHYNLNLGIMYANDKTTIPFNDYFEQHGELIRLLCRDRKAKKYKNIEFRHKDLFIGYPLDAFYDECLIHRSGIVGEPHKANKGKKALIMVHPFFTALTNWDLIEEQGSEGINAATNYLENVKRTLTYFKDKKEVDVILVESPEHYAAFSSLLVEDGRFTNIAFTEFSNGNPLEHEGLRNLESYEQVYVAGGEVKVCLRDFLSYLKGKADPSKLTLVPELTFRGSHNDAKVESSEIIEPKLSKVPGISLSIEGLDHLRQRIAQIGSTISLDELLTLK